MEVNAEKGFAKYSKLIEDNDKTDSEPSLILSQDSTLKWVFDVYEFIFTSKTPNNFNNSIIGNGNSLFSASSIKVCHKSNQL